MCGLGPNFSFTSTTQLRPGTTNKTWAGSTLKMDTENEKKAAQEDPGQKLKRSTPWNIGCRPWCKKYFWEGQALRDEQKKKMEELTDDEPWYRLLLTKYRPITAFAIPVAFAHTLWWGIAIQRNLFPIFKEKYVMSFVMILGSLIAGMTSEGGGAVAFPVLTLLLGAHPSVARDVSLMVQVCGMSCATFAIFFMKIHVEFHAIGFCILGGSSGVVFGLYHVDPRLTPAWKKMMFVSIWFSFAFCLFLLNRYHKRKTFVVVPKFKPWKGFVLFMGGFVGGLFTSFAGSGVDICCFSILTLLFRVSEKTVTPTSVVLMAITSWVGLYWRYIMLDDVSQEAWDYISVCAPVVFIGAPFGAVLGSHFHRQTLAATVYVIDVISIVSAFVYVDQTAATITGSIGIILAGFMFFGMMAFFGNKMMLKLLADGMSSAVDVTSETESNSTESKYLEEGIDNPAFESKKENEEEVKEVPQRVVTNL